MGLSKALTADSRIGAARLYEALLRQLVLRPDRRIEAILVEMMASDRNENNTTHLAQINQLKGWLDSFRPLSPTVLSELKQRFDVRFTYDSNAIKGNRLSLSETE